MAQDNLPLKQSGNSSPVGVVSPADNLDMTIDNGDQLNSATQNAMILDDRQQLIARISNRLLMALLVLLASGMIGGYLLFNGKVIMTGQTALTTMLTGCIGGFIGLQRRLQKLTHNDLLLLARSWVHVILSPFVGGILALLLYVIFISGLLAGDLFPTFIADPSTGNEPSGLRSIANIHGKDFSDYGKLIFWCFLAGYSERFVTNIISHFETNSGIEKQPED